MGEQEALKNKGNEFFKQQKFAEAVEWYTKAIELNPDIVPAAAIYSNRSASFMGLKEYPKAIADAEKCYKLRPEWVKGWFRKAVALDAQNELELADHFYKESLSREPQNEDIKKKQEVVRMKLAKKYLAEGRALQSKGDVDKAEQMYTKAIGNSPNDEEIQKMLHAARDKIAARNKTATPQKMRNAADAKTVGNSFFKQGQYETALGFYSKAIELSEGKPDPERYIYYTNRGICHAQTHSFKSTVVDCNMALDCDGIPPQGKVKALLRRALAFEGLEKWQKAMEDFQEVNRIAPGTMQATQGVGRCQRMLR